MKGFNKRNGELKGERVVCNDERVTAESNRIYRFCFYVLSGGMLADLTVKFNLYNFSENALMTAQLFLPEVLLLFAVFYMNVFMLARKGIPFGAEGYGTERCPVGRYAVLSAIISLVISVGLWTPRFAFGSWEYGAFSAILFCAAIYLITFVIAFTVLFLSFVLAFSMAKRRAEKD